jgi:integrase
VVYALELLAGVRTGEAAALRWRHYDPTVTPLGKLLVARSYNTRRNIEKTTKTDAVKHVPVHPVLAAILAEWKLGGWAEMMGRAPGPDDLIVPLPPDAAERRRSRDGEPFRGHDYSGKRWRGCWTSSRAGRRRRPQPGPVAVPIRIRPLVDCREAQAKAGARAASPGAMRRRRG